MTESAPPASAPAPRLGNFPQRVLTAAIGIPPLVAAVWFGGWWLAGLAGVAAGVAVLEVQAARGRLRTPLGVMAVALAALLAVTPKLGLEDASWVFALAAVAPAAALAFTRDPREGVLDWLWASGPVLYVGWLAAHFVLLRESPDGRDWVLVALFTVWITDTGAYFLGRAIGRHKMAPAVSPGKTWEGALGGQIAGLAAVASLTQAFGLGVDAVHVVALGLILPAAAQLGDLAESALKRGLGVKDSSALVPGHGGILDRLDSLLFAAPAVYWYLKWLIL